MGCDAADQTLVEGERGTIRGGQREPQTMSNLHIVMDNIMGWVGGFRTEGPLEESCTGHNCSCDPSFNAQFAKETRVRSLRPQHWAGLSSRVLHLTQVLIVIF